MATTDHAKGFGRVEARGTRHQGDGFFAGIDDVTTTKKSLLVY
jgi:hypothetical protein